MENFPARLSNGNVTDMLSFAQDQACVQRGGGLTQNGFKAPMDGVYRFSFSATSGSDPTNKNPASTRVEVRRTNPETQQTNVVFWISDCTQGDYYDWTKVRTFLTASILWLAFLLMD